MAIIWAESFDLYGTDINALVARGYSNQAFTTLFTGAGTRTGQGAIRHDANSNNRFIVRTLDAPVNVLGQGVAMRCFSTPSGGLGEKGIRFGTAASPHFVSIIMNGNLGVNVYSNNVLVGSSANNVLALNSYFWVETRCANNTANGGLNTGSIEVRINGSIAVVVNGLAMPDQFTSIGLGQYNAGGGNTPGGFEWDDWVVWDNSGAYNNNFLGDRRCVTSFPDANGALQDWTPTTPPAYACIDEAVINDADYIEAAAAGNISEFSKAPIGFATNDVAAAIPIARAYKNDAGVSSIRLGLNSAGNVINGPARALNTTASYISEVIERNPDGNVQWTKATLDAATLRLTRDA